MKKTQRTTLTKIMKSAWQLARQGAKAFGGSPLEYIKIALLITWYDEKHPSTWQPGLGIRFLLPNVKMKREIMKGQLLFPGISL